MLNVRRWTEDDKSLLLKLRKAGARYKTIASVLNKGIKACRQQHYILVHGHKDARKACRKWARENPDKVKKHRTRRLSTGGWQNIRHCEAWDSDDVDHLLALVDKGMTYMDIHKTIGRSINAIQHKLDKIRRGE